MSELKKLIDDCKAMDIQNQIGTFGDAFLPDRSSKEYAAMQIALANYIQWHMDQGNEITKLRIELRDEKERIEDLADSLRDYTPVIQWGAVSQKWHVTFMDWTDEVHTGNTILEALEAAAEWMKKYGGNAK